MLTVREAKIIAGRLLVEKYGISFVRDNIDKRLFTTCMDQDESFRINFELFKHDIGDVDVIKQGRLINNEGEFPDIILAVEVNKDSRDASVLS